MGFFDFLNPVGRFAKNAAVGLEHTAANALDVANAARQGVQGLVGAGVQSVFGTDESYQNELNKTQKAVDYSLKASRGAYTPEEAKSKDIGMSFLKPLARNVATYAPFFVAPTILGATGDAAAGFAPTAASSDAVNLARLGALSGDEGLNNLALQTALKTPIEATTAARLATGAAAGEAFNTGAGVAGQAANGQKIDVGKAAKEAIPATLLSSGIDVAHEGFGFLKDQNASAGETGSIAPGGNVNEFSPKEIQNLAEEKSVAAIKDKIEGSVPPEKLDVTAQAIASTNDPNIVSNILKGGNDIPAETPPAPIPAPSDVKDAINQEVQNRLTNPNSEAPQVAPGKVADTAYQETVKNGGVTINLENKQPSGGIAYSPYKDTEQIINKDSFTPENVDNYVKTHADKLNVPGNHLGIWEDNGKIYMDISQVGEKSAATLQKAIDAKQLAAFDLGSFNEIPLGKIEKGVYNQSHEASSHPYLNEGQNATANPQGAGGEPSTVPSQNPVQQVIEAIKSAVPVREAQEASYSAERSSRLGSSQAAGADLPGLAGHQAEGAALKGELAKQQYAGLSEKLAPEAQDNLYTTLRQQVKDNQNITGYQEYNTNEALRKVIYGDAGVPTRSEIALLKNAFGGDFADTVQSEIKSSLGEKAFALWRTGLLTGPQTLTKIVVSHLVQGGKIIADKLPTAAVDKFVSLFTGERSTSATLRGTVEGWKLGVGDAVSYLRDGIDKSDPGNTLELRNSTTFNSKILQAYTDFVGRAHGSLYKPFSGAAFTNSLFDQAITGAKNAGLSGDAAESFIQDFVKNPAADALKTAKNDADQATFQQETALGKVASAIQQKGGILGKVIVPFTKIPSAIATDLVNYSPIGAIKTIFDGIKASTKEGGWDLADQRAFSQGLGRSITGSAAIIPGIMLYNKGIMTLGYPSDPTEQKLWAAEGKQPNSVLVGGQWRSLGSLGPIGSVLSIGGHIADSTAQGNDLATAITDGFVGGAQSIEEQSYLRGVSGAVNAVNDPGRYATNFAKQTAGSIVPTGIATVAGATDSLSRQTNSPLDTIKSRVPGFRQTLAPKVDAFGNPIKAPETGFEKILDPFQSSTATPSTQLTTALRDLQNQGHGIIPSAATKNTTFDKVKTPLPPQLLTELTTNIGQKTQAAWSKIVASDAYQNQPDPAKQKQMLQTIYDRIVAVEKTKFARQHQLGRYSPNYRANVKTSQTKALGVLQ